MKKYLIFISIGFELVGIILAAFYIGEKLDETYHTKGLAFVGLAIMGLISWLIRVVWMLNKIQKNEDKDN